MINTYPPQSIPHIISGSHTICHAETGCGKTFCYLIPLVHKLLHETYARQTTTQTDAPLEDTDNLPWNHNKVQYLVFAPTPELGLQISNMFELIRPPE